MISTLRILAILLAVGLTGLIVWAGFTANFLDSFGRIVADPWGLVSLADLYLGFVATSLLVWLFEADRKVALMWIVPVYFLGNVVIALWLVIRLPELVRRLRVPPETAVEEYG